MADQGSEGAQGAQRVRRPTVEELNDGIVKAKANLSEVMLNYSCVRIQAIVRGAVARQKFVAHRHDIERKMNERKLSPSDQVRDCYDYVMWMSILPADQIEKGDFLGLASPRAAPGSSSSGGGGGNNQFANEKDGGEGPAVEGTAAAADDDAADTATTAAGGRGLGGRQRARFDARIVKVLLTAKSSCIVYEFRDSRIVDCPK